MVNSFSILPWPARRDPVREIQRIQRRGGDRLRRLRRVALLSLALLSVFTMAAGVAVAHLLPPRLALWRLPTVAAHRLAEAGPVLSPVPDPAAGGTAAQAGPVTHVATAAGVTAALSGLLGSAALGSHVGAVVTDLSSGQVLLSRQGSSGFAPASTAKLAVATAALHVLGPAARFTTRVVAGPTPSSVDPGRGRRPDAGRRAAPGLRLPPAGDAGLAGRRRRRGRCGPGASTRSGSATTRRCSPGRCWPRAGRAATSPAATSPRSSRWRWTRAG